MTRALWIVGIVLLLGAAAYGLSLVQKPEGQGTPQVQASEYTNEGPYHSIRVLYPEAPQKQRTSIEAEMQELVAQFKQNARVESLTPADIEIMSLGGERKFTLAAEYKTYVSGEYTSYLYTIYEDMLGAHPNGYFMTFVFDAEGNAVELGSLFPQNPNWLGELSLLVSNDVSAQYRARAGIDDLTGLLYPEGLAPKVENFQNFVLDQDDLVIFIPPYQVAAYAAGSFEVRIPLADLR